MTVKPERSSRSLPQFGSAQHWAKWQLARARRLPLPRGATRTQTTLWENPAAMRVVRVAFLGSSKGVMRGDLISIHSDQKY
jgi:hypothetical protein